MKLNILFLLVLFTLSLSNAQYPPDTSCLNFASSCSTCTGVSISGGLSCNFCTTSLNSSSPSLVNHCVPSWWSEAQVNQLCRPSQAYQASGPTNTCNNDNPVWLWSGVLLAGIFGGTLLFSFIFTHIPKSGEEVAVPDKYNSNRNVLDAGLPLSDGSEPVISRQCLGLYRATRSRAFCLCFETRSISIESTRMIITTSALPKLLGAVIIVSLFSIFFLVSPLFIVWPYSQLPYVIVVILCLSLLFSCIFVWRIEEAIIDKKDHTLSQRRTRSICRVTTINGGVKSLATLERFAMMKMTDITGTSFSLEMIFNDGSRVSVLECEALKTVYRTRERVGEFLEIDSHANHLGIAGKDVPNHPPPSPPASFAPSPLQTENSNNV